MAKLDLVEREAVKDAIGFMNLHFLGHGENKSVLDSINEVPTIDAVPVVRCKDCDKFCPEEIRQLYNTEKYCMRTGWMVKDDDFCSYGERRTDERKADCVD